MIKNFDKFTGTNIIDMFSVMYSPSLIRSAARNNNSNDRFMTLAKKYCSKDINIKGIYPYAYIKPQRAFSKETAIVFLYGKSDKDKAPLFKTVNDTYIGDTIMYIYIDLLENCKDICALEDLLSDLNYILSGFSLEILLGVIATNDKLYKEYKDNWEADIFTSITHVHDDKMEFDHLIKLYKEASSIEVVREINYGKTDYSHLRDACFY